MPNDPKIDDHGGGYIGRIRKHVGRQLLHVPGAVMVIENEDGALLLQKRSDFGLWGFPGGGPEDGEDAAQQAIRETREETGLIARDPKAFGFASNPDYQEFRYPNGDHCHYHDILMYTTAYEGELTLNEESLELRWFQPDDVPEMTIPARKMLDAYLRFKETGEFQLI